MARKTTPSILAGAAAFCLVQCFGPTDNGPGGGGPLFKPVFSATSSQVADFLAQGGGGPRAKLVFVDRLGSESKLSYIDYSESQPIIRRIEAPVDPRVPMLSPDGEWVVYAVGEGAETGSSRTQRSKVYLARLAENALPVLVADSACEPRFVQDMPAGKLGIVFPTHCPDAAWEGHGRTLEVEIDVSGSAPLVGVPKVLRGDGSYTGGLSHDRKYLCGGGEDVAMLALEGGKDRPDTLSHRGIQSCNASISSSRVFTNTMLYLNFPRDSTPMGGPAPILNGGRPWSEWQAILISAYPGTLVRGYMAPDKPAVSLETNPPSFTGSKWHHPEWSNHPYFAAATLNADRYFQTGNGFQNTAWQERVYAINLRDSAALELLRPDTVRYAGRNFGGFFWPSLWVEVPAGFQEDAAWLDPP